MKDSYKDSSFSLANRMMRLLWNLVYVLLFQYSPKPFHKWRSLILKIFGAEVGHGAHIYPKVKIWAPWNIIFGAECGVANGAILYSQGKNLYNRGVHYIQTDSLSNKHWRSVG